MEACEQNIKPGRIFAAIAGVISDIGSVGKDKTNTQQGYKYRSIDDVYNALQPALAKNKVFIVPNILERECIVVGKTNKGTDMVKVVCKIRFTFFTDDGSSVEAIIIGEGTDTADKGTNKAMSVAYKYACFQVFCIPTEEMQDDPDKETLEPDKQKSGSRKQSNKKSETNKQEENTGPTADEGKITTAMINTIRNEQKRTGVTDKQILSRKGVQAKTIEEMTVTEFKAIMEVFKKTPDLRPREDGTNE